MIVLDSVLKISILMVATLALVACLRRRSAALRHWVLTAALVFASFLPLLAFIAPGWHVTRAGSWTVLSTGAVLPAPVAREASSIAEPQVATPVPAASVPAAPRQLNLGSLLVNAWLTGMLLTLALLIIGGVRLTRLATRATPVDDGRWLAIADEIAHRYGLRRRVRLLQSDHAALLATWGLFRPKIILPAAAREWTTERARIVLGHELAHIRRSDWAWQIMAEVLRSVYWFNPLMWMTCRRLRRESEQAADDHVLSLDIERTDYAAHLLALAREVGNGPRAWLPTQAMAHTSSLERRVSAMLNDRLDRRPLTLRTRITAGVVLGALAIALAGFNAAAQVSARFSGDLVDPTNAALPGVKVTVTNLKTEQKLEVRSNNTGRFEFAGLAPGDYIVETDLPGFASLNAKLTMGGQDVHQQITLQVGSLRETVTVSAGDNSASSAPETPEQAERRRLSRELQAAARALKAAERAARGPSTGIAIGGNIRTPKKLRHVSPIYPSHLQAAGTGGDVVLTARVGTNGLVEDIKVLSTAHADLTMAATQAIQKWEFDPTLLNGVEIPVNITVTVRFVP
jgi:TonB family protein